MNDNKTSGIWVSKPLVCDKEEKVIILMDSQINWEEKDERDVIAIYGLSLLLSSHLIFNTKKDISETVLQPLNSFIDCLIEDESDKKFQNLVNLFQLNVICPSI